MKQWCDINKDQTQWVVVNPHCCRLQCRVGPGKICLHMFSIHLCNHSTVMTSHWIALHSTALHCTALHCTALNCTALHYCTPMHWTTLHCMTLHCTSVHCTALHSTTMYSFTFDSSWVHVHQLRCSHTGGWTGWISILYTLQFHL